MKYDNSTRKYKSNENKEKIIKSALKLIKEKGYDAVKVSDITLDAGVSKGAFYIHFKSKEDLIEQQINFYYDDFVLGKEKSKYDRLKHFLDESIKHIKDNGLKMCQEWFSHSVKGSFYGKTKLGYDIKTINEILEDEELTNRIVSIYYGVLNMWCFLDGNIAPEKIIEDYLENEVRSKLE